MNTAQWIFEFVSLQKREERQLDLTHSMMEAFRDIMINMLGLNIRQLATGDETQPLMPLALMCGNHHVMGKMFEELKKEHGSPTDTAAFDDDEFDKFSEQLMKSAQGDGDMIPLAEPLSRPARDLYVQSEDYKQMLKSLGVKLVTTNGD